MTILQAIILGIIQGLTEFIPISSTAHLTLAGKLMGLVNPNQPEEWTAFIAVIQLGTLIAVIVYFAQDIIQIIRGFVDANIAKLQKRPVSAVEERWALLGWLIIIGSLPVGVVGIVAKHWIEGKLTKNLWVIAGSMLGLAVVLTIAEITGRRRRDMTQLTITDAIIVGVAQVFAVIPGSSRSGTTITGGLFAGLQRESAARFSFLLSIPAVGASGLLELREAMHSVHASLAILAISTAASFIVGLCAIAFMLKYLQRHTTYLFIGYRLALGIVILALLISGRASAY